MRNKTKKGITIFILFILTILPIFLFFNINISKATVPFNGHYYAYGDSITRATHTGCLNPDGTDCYIIQMVETHDPANLSVSPYYDMHYELGSGKNTSFGLANWASIITNAGWLVIEMFGINDIPAIEGYYATAELTAQNKLDMYNLSVAAGMEEHYYSCVTPFASPAPEIQRPWAEQTAHINATEEKFEQFSVRYIKGYDALDSVPYNGRMDAYVDAYYCDGCHINTLGHQLLGEMDWFIISHQDYTETATNDTIIIDANYNETIYVDLPIGWSYSNVTVTCITNSTEISWDEGKDVNGDDTIKFAIVKDNEYQIQEGSIQTSIYFISINGDTNKTFTSDATPTFCWNTISESLQYNLQIAIDPLFTTTIINISNINNMNYPVEYDENTTTVSFTLPATNKLPSSNKYYCRVRYMTSRR